MQESPSPPQAGVRVWGASCRVWGGSDIGHRPRYRSGYSTTAARIRTLVLLYCAVLYCTVIVVQ